MSKVVYAIELGYTLLLQDFKLVIIILINAMVDNISDSIIYTNFFIGIKNKHRKSNAIFNLKIAQCIIIMDEMSMVKLEILSKIRKQLAKACGFSNYNTVVFGRLSIIIVMGDFSQFLPITGHLLWSKSPTDKNHNNKSL